MFAPIRSGVPVTCSVPVLACDDTCVLFTYSRSVVPSYVPATCVHWFTASADGLCTTVQHTPLNVPPTPMRFASVFAFRKYASGSFCRIAFQLDSVDVGRTHASSVIPFVRSSDALSFTTTTLLVPLNESACPSCPVVQVAPLIVPLFPFPEISASTVPEPASKLYAATRPVGRVAPTEKLIRKSPLFA